ncbi:MAG: hypothetical protein V1861_00765 [Candidatus Micrarchaeota archaeon]
MQLTAPNRYEGFATMDAILSLLPVMFMLALAMKASSGMIHEAQESMHRQQVFDKLVSIADYTIKSGAAMHDGGYRYPNRLNEDAITPQYVESLRNQSGLFALYIGNAEPEADYQLCIIRIYTSGESREIRILHICGG